MDGTALDAEDGLKDQVELERPKVGKPVSPPPLDPPPPLDGGGEALVDELVPPAFEPLFE